MLNRRGERVELEIKSMKAYLILDGGGVKGAALAGCLSASEQLGIEPIAYAGTSAGAIIALLASVGYTGDDLHRIMVKEVDFRQFLDDHGKWLEDLKSQLEGGLLGSCLNPRLTLRTLKQLKAHYGLYSGDAIDRFLFDKVVQKFPALRSQEAFTFDDLQRAGAKPLRVVASDVRMGRSLIYCDSATVAKSQKCHATGPVIEAVRASMSYPFVFRPVQVSKRYLVDGGVTSNLPIHVFEADRQMTGKPVVAFDLLTPPKGVPITGYKLSEFCKDMLDTALGSGDSLAQQLLRNIYHVEVEMPHGISAMDFGISEAQKEQLFTKGREATFAFFNGTLPHWFQAADELQRLQALHAEPALVEYALAAAANDFEARVGTENLRCHIMLPTGYGKRIVVYQYGMDTDPDRDLELDVDAGCSGFAFVSRKPVIADLDAAKTDLLQWKMTQQQQNRIPRERRAMLSVPLFDLSRGAKQKNVNEIPVIGTFSIDTTAGLSDAGWLSPASLALSVATRWADILSKLIEPSD
jgi:NTE family protein